MENKNRVCEAGTYHSYFIFISAILVFYNFLLVDYNFPENIVYLKHLFHISCAVVVLIFFALIFLKKLKIHSKNIIILCSICFLFILQYNIFFRLIPFYLTDSAAHLHYAGRLYNENKNPYYYDMSEAPKQLNMPYDAQSLTNDGTNLKKYSYPPGSFIFSGLLLQLGFKDLRTPAFIFTLASIIALFLMFKSEICRIFFIISILSIPDIIKMPISSLFEIFWMVLLLAAYILILKKKCWASIFLACAVSFKHTPFFSIPFFIIYSFHVFGKKKFIFFILYLAAGIFIINVRYLITDFHTIIKAVLIPLSDLPSTGFGFYYVSEFIGFLKKKEYVIALQISISILLFCIYYLKFRLLRPYLFIFPIIILMFNWRCQTNYFYCYFMLAVFSMLFDIDIEDSNIDKADDII